MDDKSENHELKYSVINLMELKEYSGFDIHGDNCNCFEHSLKMVINDLMKITCYSTDSQFGNIKTAHF